MKVPGFHRWPNAPKEVEFLQHKHRHIFGIEAVFVVDHNDRDKEFFLMQKEIEAHLSAAFYFTDGGYQFEDMSCEMIATMLLKELDLIRCRVDEDGENYAEVERINVKSVLPSVIKRSIS